MHYSFWNTMDTQSVRIFPCFRKPSTCTTTSPTEPWARPCGRTSSLRLIPSLRTRASRGWTWESAGSNSTPRYEQQHWHGLMQRGRCQVRNQSHFLDCEFITNYATHTPLEFMKSQTHPGPRRASTGPSLRPFGSRSHGSLNKETSSGAQLGIVGNTLISGNVSNLTSSRALLVYLYVTLI